MPAANAFPSAAPKEFAAWCWDGPSDTSDGPMYTALAAGPSGSTVVIGYSNVIDPSGIPQFP
jgi:hypothetical protein